MRDYFIILEEKMGMYEVIINLAFDLIQWQ